MMTGHRHPTSFNGAASMRMRRELSDTTSELNDVLLQWGRIHADAEGGWPCRDSSQVKTCFNGAASMRMRRVRFKYTDPLTGQLASMGPHPYGCGGEVDVCELSDFDDLLQWGRIHADAEGRKTDNRASDW